MGASAGGGASADWGAAGWGAAARLVDLLAGSSRRKRAPPAGRLETSIEPPCSWTIP
jgi:hypothetical protein